MMKHCVMTVVCLLTSFGIIAKASAAEPSAREFEAVGVERVPPRVSERAWQQYQRQAERAESTKPPAEKTPEAPKPADAATEKKSATDTAPPAAPETPGVATVPEKTPEPSTTAPSPTPAPPQNLPSFIGQLIRVTADSVVIRHLESGEQKTLHRGGVVIKDVIVGDTVVVQYAPDRQAVVTIQKKIDEIVKDSTKPVNKP